MATQYLHKKDYLQKYKNKTNEELCKMYQEGDEEALAVLYNLNTGLISYLAKQFIGKLGSKISYEDYCQVASIALIDAAQKYDCNQTECKFSSYLSTNINWKLRRVIAEQGFAVRIPDYLFNHLYTVMALNLEYQNQGISFKERVERIAIETELTPEKVIELLKIKEHLLYLPSLDAPINGESDPEEKDEIMVFAKRPDELSLEDEVINITMSEHLDRLISNLTEKQQYVIRCYFYKDMTFQEIGDTLGLTRERIRQIQARALRELRKVARKNDLHAYLES